MHQILCVILPTFHIRSFNKTSSWHKYSHLIPYVCILIGLLPTDLKSKCLILQESEAHPAPPPHPPAAAPPPSPPAAAPKAEDKPKTEPEAPLGSSQCNKPPLELPEERARLRVGTTNRRY